ncbi:ribokinase [Acidithiobacillus caldus]
MTNSTVGTVAVVGSCNIDLVLQMGRAPEAGETCLAHDLSWHCGGKGANQAIAARRDGVDVRLVGSLGKDSQGDLLFAALQQEGIDLEGMYRSHCPTGTACIWVDDSGENRIAIYPGANQDRPHDDLEDRLANVRYLLAQLEVAPELVLAAAQMARRLHIPFVLNASPVEALRPELLALGDVLLVNRHEAARILGSEINEDEYSLACRELAQGRRAAVMTLGAAGAVWASGGKAGAVSAHPVTVVDSTGCGDAFAGVLVAALARGASLDLAVQRANAAGALAAGVLGAQDSLPTSMAIDRLLAASHLTRRIFS